MRAFENRELKKVFGLKWKKRGVAENRITSLANG
jgi:hypothetical protein